jgi:predicted protein tyrosine phosphatase
MLHVCSLADLPTTVHATGARYVLTVMANVHKAERPPQVPEPNHLKVAMDDITVATDGFVAPSAAHVEQMLDFVRRWSRDAPMVIHCYAGISRSTATAFAAACLVNPQRDELAIARQIRRASPTAFPNRLIVALADSALNRNGRMIAALEAIGPGDMTVEGRPFRVEIE